MNFLFRQPPRIFRLHLHKKPHNSNLYAERLTLSQELFKSKKETNQPPLVIAHGLLGSKRNWRALAKHFSQKGRDVMCLDMRNHGHSPHSKFMSYEVMAEDVVHTTEKFLPEHKSFDLLGHSMGGKIATIVALKYPHLVNKLIVVDILPSTQESAGSDFAKACIEALQKVEVDQSKNIADARQHVIAQLQPLIPNVNIRNWLAMNLDWTPETGIIWRCNLVALEAAIVEILTFPDIPYPPNNNPVLFIQGGNSDHMNVPERDAVIKHHFPNASIHVIKGAGHWVHSEKPYDFMRAVDAFLWPDQNLSSTN